MNAPILIPRLPGLPEFERRQLEAAFKSIKNILDKINTAGFASTEDVFTLTQRVATLERLVNDLGTRVTALEAVPPPEADSWRRPLLVMGG